MNVDQREIEIDELVGRIHSQPTQLVLAITGGGSRAIAELLERPGGSRVVCEAIVPYSAAALDDWLGGRPDAYRSAATARAMAMSGYQRGLRLTKQIKPLTPALAPEGRGSNSAAKLAFVGIGCTASLASDRPKLGPHRLHVAWQTAAATAVVSLELVKNRRTRAEEEELATRLILNEIAASTGLSQRLALGLSPDERLESQRCDAPSAWQELLAGQRTMLLAAPGADADAGEALSSAPGQLVFPGAFNPRHDGHRQMAAWAEARSGLPVVHEISLFNVDKPPLDFIEGRLRAAHFAAGETLCFTRAATFAEKAALFPGATFLVGIDTLVRIAEPRYYPTPEACLSAIEAIAARGCRFLVFGRRQGTGFCTLADVELPAALRAICDEASPCEFRNDVSSTELRRGEGKPNSTRL